MLEALKRHWPEYLMEAAGLGFFMISAGFFGTVLEYPGSPINQAISSPLLRRLLMGIAMGLTLITIVYSPWGKQSGAHLNPSFTLTFYRLGKVNGWDTFFYVVSQFVGGIVGVLLIAALLGSSLREPPVNHVVTAGSFGVIVAFVAEVIISFFLMLMVLNITNRKNLNRFTGLFAGALVATYITLEAPFSGMSMNPARTLGSAFPAQYWTDIWIYFIAPTLGMLMAAEVYVRAKGLRSVLCAKYNHENNKRCIFRCNYGM